MIGKIWARVSLNIKKYLGLNNRSPRYIKNVFKKDCNKKALLVYITSPFISKISKKHTNQIECLSIAEVLHDLGYVVDVIDYDFQKAVVPSCKYDLLIGFGFPLEQLIKDTNLHDTKIIYYGTGTHYFYVNEASMARLKDVYAKTGKLMVQSARYMESMWPIQTTFPHGIIVLGNDFIGNTFRKYYSLGQVINLPVTFHQILTPDLENKDYERAKKHFLWFGSKGAIHKGLDLLLDVFSERSDAVLHICGANPWEKEFFDHYDLLLFKTPNIIFHGFVDISQPFFEELMKQCAFVIFPSASEGGCASVVTVMGNGGLIPIISRSSGLDVEEYGFVFDDLNKYTLQQQIDTALRLSIEQIKRMSFLSYNRVSNNHSTTRYKINMRSAIDNILGVNI